MPARAAVQDPAQEEFAFPSLDFPTGRLTMTVPELAAMLDVSVAHIVNLIEGGELRALNTGRLQRGRAWYRVPLEAWRAWVYERLSAPTGGQLLAGMSDPALERLLRDAADRLRVRGKNPIDILS